MYRIKYYFTKEQCYATTNRLLFSGQRKGSKIEYETRYNLVMMALQQGIKL